MRAGDARGLTLIELVAALAVFLVVMVAVVGLFRAGFKVYNETSNDAELARNVRAAAMGDGPRRGLQRDIYEASRALSLSATSLSLLVGVDTVTYRLSGTDLVREVNGVPATAAAHLAEAGFDYFRPDAAYHLAAATVAADAVLISARLRFSRQGREIGTDVRARLRNRD